MKPSAFDLVRANSLSEAMQLLIKADGAARLVAGSQSLGPMLNLRLAQPRLLIDITGIPELIRIEDSDETVTLGACITTANIEDRRLPGRGIETLSAVAAHIAYRAVRNRGTIGGSLCHADPAADWISTLCALGAECLIAAPNGKRWLPADQFIVGAYETALAPGEILEAIKVPRLSLRGRCGYYKVCRKAGEFALAIGAVLNDPERGKFRVVIGATKGRPIVIADARDLRRADETLDEAALLCVLDQHGIADRVTRSQQVAALTRAYAQAKNP
jgi:aerobic carbon-monoxide dehydrogenase medium subunit